MVVDDLDIIRVATGPPEADAPLFVYPDARPNGSTAFQCLASITRRIAQVVQGPRSIELAQFPQGTLLHVARKPAAGLSMPDALGLFAPERSNHDGPDDLLIRATYQV
jgi:hypothetical protein